MLQNNGHRLLYSVAPPSLDNSNHCNPTSAASMSTSTSAKREMSDATPIATTSLDYYPEGRGDSHYRAVLGKAKEPVMTSPLSDRFKVTAEVTMSKIFPAGFGWQSSSILAGSLGYASDTLGFACITGVGDGVGVFLGHSLFMLAKKNLVGGGGVHVVDLEGHETSSVDMTRETQTGLLLGCAAFCSGTAWQPIVNALQGMELSFFQVFSGTWIGCGTAFYLGLRGARTILSGPFQYIHEPTFENSITDKSLSAAIGGATGFFVGTDTAYLPVQNFLIDIIGIHETTGALAGCGIAGTSTSLGFLTAQATLNVIYPTGKLWNDGK